MNGAAMATDEMEPETERPRRCPGNGVEPCNVPPELIGESGYCLPHDPARSTDRKSNAVLGGRKAGARRRRGIDVGELKTPEDAMRITARLATAAASGELSSAQARAVSVLIQQWLRAHDLNVVTKRLAELERRAKGGRRGP